MSARSRLPLAFALSVLLHGALLLGHLPQPKPPVPPRLEVRLQIPAETAKEIADPDLLEKNTLDPEDKPLSAPPPPPPEPAIKSNRPAPAPKRLNERQEQQALHKFSEYIIYPQAAVDAGREGTVHLLLNLNPDGRIIDASIAASSGHRDLDEAAVAAVRRAGRINVGGKTEFILPFTFRLQ